MDLTSCKITTNNCIEVNKGSFATVISVIVGLRLNPPTQLLLLSLLQAFTSLNAVATNGTNALANNGVYTAYLCSAGKYNNASIPGLKNAREASVRARDECCKVRVSVSGEVEVA